METTKSRATAGRSRIRLLANAFIALGVALVSAGSYMHLTVGSRTLGHCDACQPWHPLWVVTPMVLGGALVLLGGGLRRR